MSANIHDLPIIDVSCIISHMNTEQGVQVHGGMGYWVGSLASAFRKGLERRLTPFEVTPAQWAILELCYRGEANTPSGLSRLIPVDTAAISRQLDKLHEKGLIHRRRSARDRRSITVRLTEEGRALVPRLAPCVHANNEKLLSGVSDEERTALISTIQTVLINAQADVYSDDASSRK